MSRYDVHQLMVQNLAYNIQPEVIDIFSVTNTENRHSFTMDGSEMKFYNSHCPREGEVYMDLNYQIEKQVKRPQDAPPDLLNNALKGITMNKELHKEVYSTSPIRICDVPIIISRRALVTMGTMYYDPSETKTLACSLYKGTMFVHNLRQDYTYVNTADVDWGFKFEHFMLSETPSGYPDIRKTLYQDSHASAIIKTNFDGHKLIYSAQFDGLGISDEQMNLNFAEMTREQLMDEIKKGHFVEMKTKRHMITPSQENRFNRYKLLVWKLNCLFGNQRYIYCGIKDTGGVVRKVEKYEVSSMEQGVVKPWDLNTCFSQISAQLTFLKHQMANEMFVMGIRSQDIRNVRRIDMMYERRAKERFLVRKPLEGFNLIPDFFIKSYNE